MKKHLAFRTIIGISILLLASCAGIPATPNPQENQQAPGEVEITLPPVDSNPAIVETTIEPTEPPLAPTPTPTAQPVGALETYGPGLEDFPSNISPLSGLKVNDLELLDLPAVLLSIPHFPPSARPQAGLSTAPWLYEIYIGEGMTRFLTVFYGETPEVTPRLAGTCSVRTDPFASNGDPILGNRVWFDENRDGVQDTGEIGIGGICVSLYDGEGKLLETTATDSNGYYGFNVNAGQSYQLGFESITGLAFTLANVGFNDTDSDVDQVTGLTSLVSITTTDMNWDAGYALGVEAGEASLPTPTPGGNDQPSGGVDTGLPLGEVGPVRSMRLPYGHIGTFFQGGCIVAAGGDPTVLAKVPGCHYELGDDSSVNHALLDITMLRTLAEQNKNPSYDLNYTGNIYSETPPMGCQPASELDVFWNWGNQSQFRYDPLSGAYQRFADHPDTPLEFFPQTDRLTGQQLLYNNVIVMYVDYIKYAETLMDIDLTFGEIGRADLFRDGLVCHIYWNTIGGEYEQTTQHARPIRFSDAQLNPFPLDPGHTWVHVFTNASVVYPKDPALNIWKAEFHAP